VDADGPNGYDYDHTKVYVIDAEIEDNPPNRDTPEYIAYQTGTNIYYKIEPTSGWTPSEVRLYIKDSSSEIIRYVTLSNGVGEQTASWDGKNTRGQWAEPGQYTAQIRVRIYSTYIWSDTHTFYILNVQITEPDGDPEYDYQFSFNSAGTGVCVIPETGQLTGTTGIPALNADLKWTLEDISGSNKTSNPSSAEGPNVTFTYTGLPSSNSEFGDKTLTLTHQPSGLQATMDLEIFFPKWGSNHGGGISSNPNWFHYWNSSVVGDLAGFIYENVDGSGLYEPTYDILYVRILAPEWSYDVNVYFTNKYYQTSINTGADGICDTFKAGDDIQVIQYGEGTTPYATCITSGPNGYLDSADYNNGIIRHSPNDEWDLTGAQKEQFTINLRGIDKCSVTCTHELKHQELYSDVRLPGGPPYYYIYGDGDYVDDYDEVNVYGQYHLNPNRKDTYDCFEDEDIDSGLFSDNEFIAYITQYVGTVNPNSDWSDTDGKNWEQ